MICCLDIRIFQNLCLVIQSRRPEMIAQVGNENPPVWRLGLRYVSRRILPDLSLQNVMTVCRSRLLMKSQSWSAK
jgi:hypothetical protein